MESGPSCKNEKKAIYLWEMMKRAGINPGAGILPRFSVSYASAQHGCQECRVKDRCRAWLNATPADVFLPPRFCPNADILFELQVDQVGAGSQRRPKREASHVD